MRSIQRHVLLWTLGALVLGTLLLAGVAYRVSLDEYNEALDANLRQVALSVARLPAGAVRSTLPAATPGPASRDKGANGGPAAPDLEIVIQTWTPDGQPLYSSHPGAALPFLAHDGPSRVQVGTVDWDMYTAVRASVVVQVAQRAAAQQLEATESATRLLWPSLGVAAGVLLMMLLALRRGLRPLGDTAAIVAARSPQRLDPVPDTQVPRELRPLVWAINTLMQRLSAALATRAQFVADAAHALRTPVTALRLQLGLLETAPDDAARRSALAELRSGVDRSQHLLEQLLRLSRTEPGVAALRLAPVSLQAQARDAVARFTVRAEARGIDLGAQADESLWVKADADQLAVLLDNLLDNALRHTPSGGVVDVKAVRRNGLCCLQVIDSGPGIPAEQRQRVFDRFYRGDAGQASGQADSGSGLGLAISKAIADAHGAQLTLGEPADAAGLAVCLAFDVSAETLA